MLLRQVLTLKKIGHIAFKVAILLPGLFFLSSGFQWLLAPGDAATTMMMPLLKGAGLSSQVGDIGGLFLGMGLLVLGALTTNKGEYLHAVAILLGCIGLYRILAFTLLGATLLVQMVVVELVLSVWYYLASRRLGAKDISHEG